MYRTHSLETSSTLRKGATEPRLKVTGIAFIIPKVIQTLSGFGAHPAVRSLG